MRKLASICALAFCVTTSLAAKSQSASTSNLSSPSATAVKTGAVSRTTKAVHYRQGGTLKTQFQATELMAAASGEAKVEGKKTNATIDAKFQGMDEATKVGLEDLTYVLWAVSPQGRAVNLGELTPDKGNAPLKTSTDMQTSGLVVTPHP